MGEKTVAIRKTKSTAVESVLRSGIKKEEPERMYKIKIELQGVCSPSAENKH